MLNDAGGDFVVDASWIAPVANGGGEAAGNAELSASRNKSKSPSDDRLPPSKPAVSFLQWAAGRSKGEHTSIMSGVALAWSW